MYSPRRSGPQLPILGPGPRKSRIKRRGPNAEELNRTDVERVIFGDEDISGSLTSYQRSAVLKDTYNRVFNKCVEVGLGFQIVRIHRINEADETFSVDFDLHMTWMDPSVVDVKEPDWSKAWSPMLIFRNEIELVEISRKIFVSDPSRGVVFCYLKYHATFYEILELQYFPFDRQILHIDVSSFRPINELRFVPFPGRKNKVFAMPISLWDVMSTVEKEETSAWRKRLCWLCELPEELRAPPPTVITPETELFASADGLLYPRARFEVFVERRCQHYLWNMVLVVWALVLMAFLTFSIDTDNLIDRMNLLLTLVLTLVASKYTFVADMPKKAYLTWMDWYLIVGFVILVALAVEVYFAARYPADSDEVWWLENGAKLGLFGPWMLWHVQIALLHRWNYPSWRKVIASQKTQVVL